MTRRPRRQLSPAQRKAKSKRAAAKRKARLAKVPREQVDKFVLFHRQRGMCPFCDLPLLDPSAPPERYEADVRSLHHDHVFPVANGGHDTMANSQLLHPRCNLQKKRRIWPIGVTPHRDVPSARGAARTAAISHYRLTAAADNVLPCGDAPNKTEEVTSE